MPLPKITYSKTKEGNTTSRKLSIKGKKSDFSISRSSSKVNDRVENKYKEKTTKVNLNTPKSEVKFKKETGRGEMSGYKKTYLKAQSGDTKVLATKDKSSLKENNKGKAATSSMKNKSAVEVYRKSNQGTLNQKGDFALTRGVLKDKSKSSDSSGLKSKSKSKTPMKGESSKMISSKNYKASRIY